MENVSLAECRSIFIDWALSLPSEVEAPVAIAALLAQYNDAPQDHPMLEVLGEGLAKPVLTGRRGGWSGRRADRG
jgi:hypothetical protein